MLATISVVVLVVTALYVGREIFIPIAIAIPVSFVLSTPVLLLRRWGLGRVPSVSTVVLAALVIAFLIGSVLTQQVSDLAVDLPKYQATVNAKVVKLRDAAADNAIFAKVSAALRNLGEINPQPPEASSAPVPSDQPKNHTGAEEDQRPVPVEVHQPAWGPFAIVETIAGTALSSLETTFIVVIFVIFILLQREDLRNRFIRLAGSRDLHRTTLAMNDAAERLSRFFFATDPDERFLWRHRRSWPLFHRRAEPDPLGRRRILAAVCPLRRPDHRRWLSHGPGGGC
jgi:predicted PurR-regulated permease PerM